MVIGKNRAYYSRSGVEGKIIYEAQKELSSYISYKNIEELFLYSRRGFAKGIFKLLTTRSTDIIYRSIEKVVESRLVDIFSELKIPIGDNVLQKLITSYKMEESFLGKTILQRLNVINIRSMREIEQILSVERAASWKINAVTRFLKGTDTGYSYFRNIAKLIVSEDFRAMQNAGRIAGNYLTSLGYQIIYEWILSLIPNRKSDICDEYARKRYFDSSTLPDYPHVFCGCKVGIVI